MFQVNADNDNAVNRSAGTARTVNRWSGTVMFGNLEVLRTPYEHDTADAAMGAAQLEFSRALRKMVAAHRVDQSFGEDSILNKEE